VVKSPCERACEPPKARTNVPAVSRVINDRKDSRERALIVCLGGQEAKGTCASRMLAVQHAIMRRPDGSSSGCTTYDEERNLVRARYSSIYMLVSRSATARHPLIWQSFSTRHFLFFHVTPRQIHSHESHEPFPTWIIHDNAKELKRF
jgi:hypothetical protein